MKTTSHFVGLEVSSSVFVDLFVELQNYLKKNKLDHLITFQNPLSLHITLYYLDNNIFDLKNKIKESLYNYADEVSYKINGIDYFDDKICYFSIVNNDCLVEINKIFSDKLKLNTVYENSLNFIPHITFFKIKNIEKYEKYKSEIEKIINKGLENIVINEYNGKVFLYKVNSNFTPEIQIKEKVS